MSTSVFRDRKTKICDETVPLIELGAESTVSLDPLASAVHFGIEFRRFPVTIPGERQKLNSQRPFTLVNS